MGRAQPQPHPRLRRAREEDPQAPSHPSTPRPNHGLSNGLIESTNTKIRLLQRVAFGFKSADALIALAMLSLGGFRPDLAGRNPK
jgi:Transposase